LKVSTVRQDLTSDGSEFQVCGAATEKDRRTNSVRVFGMISSGASDDRRGRTGTAVWIRSFKYSFYNRDADKKYSETKCSLPKQLEYKGTYSVSTVDVENQCS